MASDVGGQLLVTLHVIKFQDFPPFCNLCECLEIIHNEMKQMTRFSHLDCHVSCDCD